MKTFFGPTLLGILKKFPFRSFLLLRPFPRLPHTNFFLFFFPGGQGTTSRTTTTIYLAAILILMLGFSYASIPLYQIYCQASGLGGTVQKYTNFDAHATQPRDPENMQENTEGETQKDVWVHFNADTSENLPWTFKPTLKRLKAYPGDTALTFYTAQNLSDHAISGISTYHVTPQKVGIYFNKIQCFCFEEQRLKAHESIEMPVLFFIDPDFKTDPKMKDVDTITLSYTFFRSGTSAS